MHEETTMRHFLHVAWAACLLAGSTAAAMDLEICNSGQDEFFIAHAETHMQSSYYSVGGWSALKAGDCWRRNDPKMQVASVLVSYVDRSGAIGIVPFDRDFRVAGPFDFQKSPYQFCMDPMKQFYRQTVQPNETTCPDDMVRVAFPLYLAERTPNAQARLAIVVDHQILHEAHWIVPKPEKKQPDPDVARYADPGEIDLIRGPSAYQIEAAEYQNLRVRLALANAVLLKNGSFDIDKVTLDQCVASKDALYYCRYKLDVTFDAPEEMKPLIGLLNAGFLIKGYYWSSFWVNNGRWQINRQYDGCTLGTDQIRCWGPRLD